MGGTLHIPLELNYCSFPSTFSSFTPNFTAHICCGRNGFLAHDKSPLSFHPVTELLHLHLFMCLPPPTSLRALWWGELKVGLFGSLISSAVLIMS